MTEEEDIRRHMAEVLREMDRSMGPRRSGAVMSGNHRPTYRDMRTHEDPLRFTHRVMVCPILSILGYEAKGDIDVF